MALDANSQIAAVRRLKHRIKAKGDPTLLARILARAQTRLGAYHLASLETQIELAEALVENQEIARATEQLVSAKQALTDALYPEHALWITLYSVFSFLYAQQRLTDEANYFMQRASQLAEDTATDVSEKLKLQHKLASCFLDQGKPQDADRVLQEVLELFQDEEVPIQTLELLRSLALQQLVLLDEGKAAQLLSRVVDESLKNPEVPNKFIVHTALRLTDIYLSLDDLEQAADSLRPVVFHPAIRDKTCPIEGLQLLKCFIELSIELDHLTEVLDCAELNLDHFVQDPATYPQEDVVTVLRMAGEVSYITAEFELARRFLSKALSTISEEHKKDNPVVADILHDMAIAAFAAGQTTEALSLCHVALNTRVKVFGDADRRTLESQLAFGMILKDCGQKEKAVENLIACADLARESDHKRSSQIAEMCQQILDEINPPKVEVTSVHEVDEKPVSYPGIQTQVAASIETNQKVTELFSNAMLQIGNQDYQSAVRLLNKALEVLESKFGSEHPDLIPVLQSLSGAHEALQHSEEVKSIRQRLDSLENRG